MIMSKESCYEEIVDTDKASGRVIRFWVVIGILALARYASAALSVDWRPNRVKRIGACRNWKRTL